MCATLWTPRISNRYLEITFRTAIPITRGIAHTLSERRITITTIPGLNHGVPIHSLLLRLIGPRPEHDMARLESRYFRGRVGVGVECRVRERLPENSLRIGAL